MFPWSPFSGIWQRIVDHLLPRGAEPGQVVVEPDLINSPEAVVRAVAAGPVVAPGILGVAEHMGVSGVVVRPLDPPLFVDLEVVWRRPARPAVRRLVDFLVEAADGPKTLVSPPRRYAEARTAEGSAPPSRSRPPRS
jgi:LysR family transcriptional regulator, benzoate and cis,cis-muconate-responsive activator of ben and cat genes